MELRKVLLKEGILRNIQLMYAYRALSRSWIYLPIQIILFGQVSGSYAKAMTVIALGNIISSVLEIPTGCWSDKYGRKTVCSLGALSMFIAIALWTIANSFAVLCVGAFFYGAYYALSSGNNEALIYETLVQARKKKICFKVMSDYFSIGQFSLALSSLLCAALMFISIKAVMIATMIMMFSAFVITLFLIEPKHVNTYEGIGFKHTVQSMIFLWKNKKLRYYGLAETFEHGLNEGAFYFNSIFFKMFVPEWSLGIFRFFGHLFDAVGAYVSRFAEKNISNIKIAMYGSVGSNLINICSVLVSSFMSPVLKIGSSFAIGFNSPAAEVVWQDNIESIHRATIRSVVSLCKKLSFALFSFLIGYMADITNPYWAMLSAYVFALVSNVFYMLADKRGVRCNQ